MPNLLPNTDTFKNRANEKFAYSQGCLASWGPDEYQDTQSACLVTMVSIEPTASEIWAETASTNLTVTSSQSIRGLESNSILRA